MSGYDPDLFGGFPPHVTDCETSTDAAAQVAWSAASVRERVYAFVKAQGACGATCDEVEAALGLSHQSASARLRELALKDRVVDSCGRRLTRLGRKAIVWYSLSLGCEVTP